MRIALADDSALFRSGLVLLLEASGARVTSQGAHNPDIGILVLSTFAEASYASQLMDAVGCGAGYLLKDNVTDAGNLISQLSRIAAGETVIDPAIVRRLIQRKRSASRMDALNQRERVTSVFAKLGLDQTDTDKQPHPRRPHLPEVG